MNATFHALTAVGIAHIAAMRLDSSRERWFYHSDVWVLGSAFTLGVLSHGVLDGLKHGYPIQTVPDVLCAGVLAICWCKCVHRRFFLLFASVSLASFAPDIVDHGPRMLRSATGIWTPVLDATPLFPWHWPDGSGSMYSMLSRAPQPTRILDVGQNRIVSWTNHFIVVAFAASGDFRKPTRVSFLVAPGHTYEEDDVIVVLSSRPAYTGCAPVIDTRTISGGMLKRTGTIAQPSPPETTKSHCSRT
jgi:hypothetical protein